MVLCLSSASQTEEDAKQLLTLACPVNLDGEYYARELVEEQTLENLGLFSDRLAESMGVYAKQAQILSANRHSFACNAAQTQKRTKTQEQQEQQDNAN